MSKKTVRFTHRAVIDGEKNERVKKDFDNCCDGNRSDYKRPFGSSRPKVNGLLERGSKNTKNLVAYRGGHGSYGDLRNYGYSSHRGHGLRGAGIIGGIVAGSLIAGAIRESRADASDVSRCQETYKSFDSETGTYIGYDGERHICPYLD